MNRKELGKAIIMMVVIGVLILLAINSEAIAQEVGEEPTGHGMTESLEDKNTMEVAGGPGFISIHPAGLHVRTASSTWAFSDEFELYNTSSLGIFASAPVYLPDGAVVNKVTFFYYDGTASYHTSAYLTRTMLSGQIGNDMATIYSSGSGYGYGSDTTIVDPTIDNQNYAYFVDIFIPGDNLMNLRVTGLRIDYGYTTFVPTIMK
ncbi:MAG: hypothetical protein GYA40_05210 [Chloroflexi bacterium]|nr:hypothetical protein [Chloroflexota bacterium]